MKKLNTLDISMSMVLIAVAVILSPLYIPIGPTKCYPAQHMVNAISGVLLGPWYAILIATMAGIIRNLLGTGTIFAFPGGIPGALIVGLIHEYVLKKDYAALTEPIGTSIGAFLSALIVAPIAFQLGVIKSIMSLQLFFIAFLLSSIPGTLIGFTIVLFLRKSGIIVPKTK
ncbi:MAG: energy coupling factor transporter S component ThiW [Candidatus Bathyarchaeia archaeon]